MRVDDAGTNGSRVAVSGASGLVGRSLCAAMESGGVEVVRLVRREPAAGPGEVFWNPATGQIDRGSLEGVDAVVHLAGENIASGRWTDERKARLRDSRVAGTSLLSEALAGLDHRPAVLVSASAVGYYGDRGDEVLDEGCPPGTGFLSELARAWESAVAPAERAGIRVVKLRIGVVLSEDGGALAKMLPPFRLGLGGRLGSGRQMMSWIALDDLVAVIRFVIVSPGLAGPINATAPRPVSNAEFTRCLARVLGRPALLPVPATAIRALFGEMADELLLGGADARPRRLEQAGFRFLHPELQGALRAVLGLD